jgi:hypothetical protein
MFLVFLDECGSAYRDYSAFYRKYERRIPANPGAPMPPYPFFILAGVGIHECHLSMVDEWFSGIKRRFLRNPEAIARREYEIKGEILYALREGRSPAAWQGARKERKLHIAGQKAIWTSLKAHQLEYLETSIFDLLGRLSPVVWAIVVKQREVFRRHKHATWAPYYWALTYLQQRVLHYVQASRGAYERAMFLMDETNTLSSAAQFDDYLSTRESINSMAAWPVEFGRYLVDIPLFGKSHLHEALQLADVVAHGVWRHFRNSDRLGWFGRIEGLLATYWRTGTYENAGLTVIE